MGKLMGVDICDFGYIPKYKHKSNSLFNLKK